MFVTSRKSSKRIVHLPDCYHLNNVNEENYVCHETLNSALSAGCHVCADCLKAEKKFDDDYKKISKYAKENNMTWDITDKAITIKTSRSSWKVMAGEDGKYVMYHANENGISKKGDVMPGYHLQNARYSNIGDYFRYVVEHDEYRRLNPVKPTKRKGTAGYKKQMEIIEKKRKYWKVTNVYNLIDSLSRESNARMAFNV